MDDVGRQPRPGGLARLLGPVDFVDAAGRVITLPSPSQRRLLAVLALGSGATLRPEQLGDQLELSTGALRTTLSRLRARVGPETVATDPVGYRFTAAVDAAEFTDLLTADARTPDREEVLERALGLWRGPALDEFAHEPWAVAEVARLEELRAVAWEELAEARLEGTGAAAVVAALEAHVVSYPYRDRPRGLLIRALAAEGRRSDALRAYQEYRRFLAEDTGTEPSAAVRDIERRVATGWDGRAEPGLRADPHAAGSPDRDMSTSAPLAVDLALGAELIGRRRELTWLESDLLAARTGGLRIVRIGGEPGIGKTTLVAAFARAQHDRDDALVVFGRCEDRARVPLQPFRDVVGSLVDQAPDDALKAHCERVGGELQRVTRRLGSRVAVPPPTGGDDATGRFLLFEAVADLVRRVATLRPLVMVLDDLHWAESTALALLTHLVRAVADVPAMIVVSYRDTEERDRQELTAAMAALDRAGARHIALGGFDDAEMSDLVRALASSKDDPAAALLDELRSETGGNPLYADQLLRHLFESGQVVVDDEGGPRLAAALPEGVVPPSLRQVVSTRVVALGEHAHRVLRAAAVLGTSFDEGELCGVLDADPEEVADAIDAAVDAGLVLDAGVDGGPLRFAHALVAHALYSELRSERRRRLHERAARTLEGTREAPDHTTVVALAHHWGAAGDAAAARRWATAAGDHALAHLAPSEAADWYRTALRHGPEVGVPPDEDAELLVRLGEALMRAGEPEAHDTLHAAAAAADRSGRPLVVVRAALANDRGFTSVGAGDDRQLPLVEAALRVVDPADVAGRAQLLALCAQELARGPRRDEGEQHAHEAIDLVDRLGDDLLLARVVPALNFALWAPGSLESRRALVDRAMPAAAGSDDPFLHFWTCRAACHVAVQAADEPAARDSFARMRSIAERVGEPRLRWVVMVHEVFVATMEARLDDAARLSDEMLELGTALGEGDAGPLWAGQLFVNRSFAGRYDEMLPALDDVVRANPGVLSFRLARAITCAATGRLDEAGAVLEESRSVGFSRVPPDFFWMTNTIGYAVLALELEDRGAAGALYRILEPFAEEVSFNGASSQGPVSAYLGKLASLQGRHDEADAHLQRALATCDAFGWRYHRATTLVARASAQVRRAGVLDHRSQGWLEDAAAIAQLCGLEGVSASVAALRAGREAPAPVRSAHGADPLR